MESVQHSSHSETLQYVIVHSGSNNLEHDSADDIANATLLIGYKLLQINKNFKIILSGILPRGEKGSMIRKKITAINDKISK